MRVLFAAASLGALSTITANAAALAPRQSSAGYVTVLTETEDNIISREYPDNLAPVIEEFGSRGRPINVTCWTFTTMWDDKGITEDNPLWLGFQSVKPNPSGPISYISETKVQGGDIDFQEAVPPCPAVQHAVVFVPSSYWQQYTDANGLQRSYVPCYEQTTLSAKPGMVKDVTYPEISCYQQGETVNGNGTWAKALREACFMPGGWFEQGEYHGVAGLC